MAVMMRGFLPTVMVMGAMMVRSVLVLLPDGCVDRLMMNHVFLLMGDDVCLPPTQTEEARIHYSDVPAQSLLVPLQAKQYVYF